MRTQDNLVIRYEYVPEGWNDETFRLSGGFTAVFLNYNKKQTIKDAVESVLAQDYPLVECFFMDDASSDGSEVIMEELCRAYRGPFKVTVTFNKKNKNITGQWNTVSKFAKGQWFGMFCGDDIAYPNRISVASEMLKRYPTLRGFCTEGDKRDINGLTGETILNSKSALASGASVVGPTIGATAFWHRSLFEQELPNVPLDDILLRWVLHWKYASDPNIVWLYDAEIKTIQYGVGDGVTSFILRDKTLLSEREKWVDARRQMNKYFSISQRTCPIVLAYLKAHYPPQPKIQRMLEHSILKTDIIISSTWKRFLLLPRIIWARNGALWMLYVKRTFLEFFGLRVAAWLSCNFKSEKSD